MTFTYGVAVGFFAAATLAWACLIVLGLRRKLHRRRREQIVGMYVKFLLAGQDQRVERLSKIMREQGFTPTEVVAVVTGAKRLAAESRLRTDG